MKSFETSERLTLTLRDYDRLMSLIEYNGSRYKLTPEVSTFYSRVASAHVAAVETIDSKIVRLNSRVVIKDSKSGRMMELHLVLPECADRLENRISVFSNIGMSLIGKKVGDLASWKVPSGMGLFEIVMVYQQD